MNKNAAAIYTMEEVKKHDTASDCWIVIHNKVYDVTEWAPNHPGGNVILKFAGAEVTDWFEAFHLRDNNISALLKKYEIGTLNKPYHVPPLIKDFRKLRAKFLARGFFKTQFMDYFWEVLRIAIIAVVMVFFHGYGSFHNYLLPSFMIPYAPYVRTIFGGILTATVWHQAALVAHDLFHCCVFHNLFWDNVAGWFFGNVLFGSGGHWWKDDHNKHHAYTNLFRKEDGVILDLQQNVRPFFIQNSRLLTYISNSLERLFIRIQMYTFFPFVWGVGRYAILVVSYCSKFTRNFTELFGILLHWCWVLGIIWLGHSSSYTEMALTLWIACTSIGILHVQLELNHFGREMYTMEELRNMDFFTFQCNTSRNISVETYFDDCLHGGLQYQIEHHLFPKMCKHRFKEAKPEILKLCKKYNVEYDTEYFIPAISKVMSSLNEIGKDAVKSPKKKE